MLIAQTRAVLHRLPLLVALALSAIILGVGLGVAYAADQRLTDADAALEKADALLAASESGVTDPKKQRAFDKAVANARNDIASARAKIAVAQAIADSP